MAFNKALRELKKRNELHYLVEKVAYYLFESTGKSDARMNWNNSITAVSVYPSKVNGNAIRLVTETDLHLELKRRSHEEFEFATQILKIPRNSKSQEREWNHSVESLANTITEYYMDKFFLEE